MRVDVRHPHIPWGVLATAAMMLTTNLAQSDPLPTQTADRTAMFYAPQFNFTRSGEPLIHVGVMQGSNKAEFSSRDPIQVLPLGEGGPEINLPGGRTYTVKLDQGKPGSYRHWVVVQRFSYGNDELIQATIEAWVERGYLPNTIEIGGLFAVGGRRFDSRAVLVTLGGYDDRSSAQALAQRLTRKFGIETEFHRELLSYPTGRLSLGDHHNASQVVHQDVFWVSPTREGQTFRLQTHHGERTYAGSLVFTLHHDGSLSTVNVVPVETLLKGVVPSEVYTSAPMESLKAQAVAARGTLISALGVRHLADPFLLCSEVHCQAYSGLTREHPRTNQAVEETRGELMFARSNPNTPWHIVDARYSANCGGYSEHNDHVWGGAPQSYLRGHADTHADGDKHSAQRLHPNTIQDWVKGRPQAWCNTERYGGKRSFRWDKTVDVATLESWLEKQGHDLGQVKQVDVLERGVSGRVIRMSIQGAKGTLVLDRELTIRRAFGGLRSSMFIVSMDSAGRFRFQGGGFGHGVGMCQTGAMMMAHAGYDHRSILGHYYTGARLEKLY
ncbi:MAG: SpoIID/LytB domain-containing protein [Myxococcota bacterium]